MHHNELKALLLAGRPEFWAELAGCTRAAREFDELFLLSSLRKKAHARKLVPPGAAPKKFRVALLGGYSLYPFHELLEHLCEMSGTPVELWRGEFDNYISEIMDGTGGLYEFKPQAVLLMPSEHRCKYMGQLSDSREMQQAEANCVVNSLLELVRGLHEKSRAEIIMTNFMLPARHDLGAFRSRTLGADWTFRKWVNLELGLNAPSYLHICDLEFLAHRIGGLAARDERAWFESKQPCSPALLPDFAREVAHLIAGLRQAPKKVLVLDLDNTLWGGVVADDGLEGIEVGDTSPRGEAFKAFQKYILSFKQRGTLLAVCSKNDLAKAQEPFEKHPERVLRLEDFVSFKANWEPKSDNIRQMAVELNLGLDSFVFVDDNPAEIEIVRQFTPEVTTILLGPDPSEYVGQLSIVGCSSRAASPPRTPRARSSIVPTRSGTRSPPPSRTWRRIWNRSRWKRSSANSLWWMRRAFRSSSTRAINSISPRAAARKGKSMRSWRTQIKLVFRSGSKIVSAITD